MQENYDNFKNIAERKKILVNNIEWEYFVSGTGQNPLLILTGGGSIAEAAFLYINKLSENYKVISPTIPKVHTVQECLNGINKILEQENIPSTNILGFSMGGMLSQCFVRAYPTKVSKLILFVSMLPSQAYAKKYAKYKRGISVVPEFIFKSISKRSLQKRVLKDKDLAPAADIKFWVDFFNWEFDSGKMNKKLLLATTDVLIDYFTNYSFTPEDLKEWDGKVLLIESDKDETISAAEREKFKAAYPQSKVVVQEGSGHFGEGLLNPSNAIEKIQEFLGN